jgi:hypothetical protein
MLPNETDELPIVARLIGSSGDFRGDRLRVVRLAPTGMLVASRGLKVLAGEEFDFQVTVFAALDFRVRGRVAPSERDAAGECTVHFTELDKESRRLLDEAFQRFSHVPPGEVGEIASRLGQPGKKRVPTAIPATLIIGEIWLAGTIENLSETGAFIAMPEPIPLNVECLLRFALGPGQREVSLQSRVVWRWAEIKHGWTRFNPGVGLQFIGGRLESLRAVEEFVAAQLARLI